MIRAFKALSALLSLLLVLFAGASFAAAVNSPIYQFVVGVELGLFGQIAWAAVGALLVTLSVVFWILAFNSEAQKMAHTEDRVGQNFKSRSRTPQK